MQEAAELVPEQQQPVGIEPNRQCLCGCDQRDQETSRAYSPRIDAEWQMELADANYESPLLRAGWNVSQYKQRDVFALGRASTARGFLEWLSLESRAPAPFCLAPHDESTS